MELIERPDQNLSRSDLRILGTAIRQNWDIPEDILKKVPQKMMAIINRRKDGDDRNRIAAARVLVAMLSSNQPQLVGHLHQHNIQGESTRQEADIESRRQNNARRLATIERLGGDA